MSMRDASITSDEITRYHNEGIDHGRTSQVVTLETSQALSLRLRLAEDFMVNRLTGVR
jgi:hypothetical protein